MGFQPPAGYDDMETDADEHGEPDDPRFLDLDVPKVGIVRARKPLPNAVPALAKSANAKIGTEAQSEYMTKFAQNHLAPGELDRVLEAMMDDEMPADAVLRIVKSIATWGTPRPTGPSSISR